MSHQNFPRRITVAEMAPHVHSFGVNENKVNKITEWMSKWLIAALSSGKIKSGDLLPSKGDLAFHIGVSKGTIQNVFRNLEDEGFVESKQRLGTFIKNQKDKPSMEKLTSKREFAIEVVKEYLQNEAYTPGDSLISIRQLAQKMGISNSTIRSAVLNLVSEGILEKRGKIFVVKKADYIISEKSSKTLAEKTASKIHTYIEENLQKGGKLPSNTELARIFNVSVKTIHDALKQISKSGLIYSRRGRYGTLVTSGGDSAELYFYEKTEIKIRQYIIENCKAGDKLPSISNIAEQYGVSPKTVKKALDNLSEDGYLVFRRGRYGGTFVIEIPQEIKEAYKWLAISSDYVSNAEN